MKANQNDRFVPTRRRIQLEVAIFHEWLFSSNHTWPCINMSVGALVTFLGTNGPTMVDKRTNAISVYWNHQNLTITIHNQ
ncbi:hypothetical protein ACOSP7_022077 [Xanthoceras sorbifolium]